MRLVVVPPNMVWKVWPLVESWVDEAIQKGRGNVTPEEIKEGLIENTMRMWLIWDNAISQALGCCVCEIINSVRGKALNMVIVSGNDLSRWWHLVDGIKEFARSRGCVRLQSNSRAGMVVLLKQDGWRELNTVMELRLDDG